MPWCALPKPNKAVKNLKSLSQLISRSIFRYGLLALAVYVIFNYLHVPIGSMVVGLCALAAATIAASVWEILHPVE